MPMCYLKICQRKKRHNLFIIENITILQNLYQCEIKFQITILTHRCQQEKQMSK